MAMRVKRKKRAMDVIRGREQVWESLPVEEQSLGHAFGEIQRTGGDGQVESTPAFFTVGPVERRAFRSLARQVESTERIVIRLAPDRAEIVLKRGPGRRDVALVRNVCWMHGFHELTAYVREDMPEQREVGEVLLVCPHDKEIAARVRAPLEIVRFDEPLFCVEEVVHGEGPHCAISLDFRTGQMVTHCFESLEEAMAAQEANVAATRSGAGADHVSTADLDSIGAILQSACSVLEAA